MILLVISVSYPSNLNLKIFLKKGCKIPETMYFIFIFRLFLNLTDLNTIPTIGNFYNNY